MQDIYLIICFESTCLNLLTATVFVFALMTGQHQSGIGPGNAGLEDAHLPRR